MGKFECCKGPYHNDVIDGGGWVGRASNDEAMTKGKGVGGVSRDDEGAGQRLDSSLFSVFRALKSLQNHL